MSRFDEEKTITVLLYLAQKAGGQIGWYEIVKLVYFADKQHLHEWGRTITGDKYAKMEHGTTPSATYDMLKAIRGDKDWPRDLSGYFKVTDNVVTPLVEPDMDELSESEIQVLDAVYAEDGGKPFPELREKAHDKAYDNAADYWMGEEDLAEGDALLISHIRQTKEDQRFLESW